MFLYFMSMNLSASPFAEEKTILVTLFSGDSRLLLLLLLLFLYIKKGSVLSVTCISDQSLISCILPCFESFSFFLFFKGKN